MADINDLITRLTGAAPKAGGKSPMLTEEGSYTLAISAPKVILGGFNGDTYVLEHTVLESSNAAVPVGARRAIVRGVSKGGTAGMLAVQEVKSYFMALLGATREQVDAALPKLVEHKEDRAWEVQGTKGVAKIYHFPKLVGMKIKVSCRKNKKDFPDYDFVNVPQTKDEIAAEAKRIQSM